VKSMVKKKALPSSPMAIATAPVHDPSLDQRIGAAVTGEFFARAAGKKSIGVIVRRTPVVGGGVGAVTDGYATFEVGRYAARELRRRKPRS
jgi:hypothetical protein